MPVVRGGGGHGHAINPTTPNQGHFILSPVSLESRDQDDGQIELKDRHQQSHGKTGDCEQSNYVVMQKQSTCVLSSKF